MIKSEAALILVENFHIRGSVTLDDDGTINMVGQCSVKHDIDTSAWQGKLPCHFGNVTGNFDCTIGCLSSWDELPKSANLVLLSYDPTWPILNVFCYDWPVIFVSKRNLIEDTDKAKRLTEIVQYWQTQKITRKSKIIHAQRDLLKNKYCRSAGFS